MFLRNVGLSPIYITSLPIIPYPAQLAAYFWWFLVWLTIRPSRWTRYIPPKRRIYELQPYSPEDRSVYSHHCQNLRFNRHSIFVPAKYKIGYSYYTENTPYLHYKDRRLMLFGQITDIYCENHKNHINILCEYVEKILNVKVGGTYSYHCALTTLRVQWYTSPRLKQVGYSEIRFNDCNCDYTYKLNSFLKVVHKPKLFSP
jgi:hypothetical protein